MLVLGLGLGLGLGSCVSYDLIPVTLGSHSVKKINI